MESHSTIAGEPRRVLLVDLNNHARYPTLAVGQMAAVLRQAGHRVTLLSPLAVGVHGAARDQKAKGVRVERLSAFLGDASRAGVSVRATMFTGYPGEGPVELEASRRLLERHEADLDRVHLSRFSIMHGTPIARSILADPARYPDLKVRPMARRSEAVAHTDRRVDRRSYRRELASLLKVVHRINRRPLRECARALEGAM